MNLTEAHRTWGGVSPESPSEGMGISHGFLELRRDVLNSGPQSSGSEEFPERSNCSPDFVSWRRQRWGFGEIARDGGGLGLGFCGGGCGRRGVGYK